MKQEKQKYTIKYLPLGKVEQTLKQPRETFESEPLDELAESMRSKGMLQPIVVRRNNSKYQVIIGGRRIRAARIVGLKTIPAIVANVNTAEAFEVALIENIQREDLTIFEEANAILHLMRSGNISGMDELAKRIGKNKSFIASRLKILQLPESIQELLAKNQIGLSQALSIAKIPDQKKQEAIARVSVSDALTATETEELVTKKVVTLKRRLKVGDTLSPIKILERLHNFLGIAQASEWPEVGKETTRALIDLFVALSDDFKNMAKSLGGETVQEPILLKFKGSVEKVGSEYFALSLLYYIEETEKRLRQVWLKDVDIKYRDLIRSALKGLAVTVARRLLKKKMKKGGR